MRQQKVWTPNGYMQGPVNSLVGKGESIIDYTNGTGTLVTKGKVGVDNQPSSVKQEDQNVIAGNDVDWTNGMKFSDQVAPLTAKLQMYNDIEKKSKQNKLSSLSKQTMELQNSQLQRAKAPILNAMKNITDRQEKQHQIEDYASYYKANCGKDRFASGKSAGVGQGKVPTSWLNAAHAIGAGAEGLMLSRWLRENPIMPNIYAANRYAPSALQTLNRLKVDPYSQLQALNKADRAAYYRMQQDGGYTGGQRQNGRIALALGNARNAADVLNNTMLQNNKYRQDWATAALAEGNQDAARRQAASQYAWEAYNRAHGAKTKGIETHLAALAAKGQKYWADRIKNKQYEDTLNIYQQDVDNRNKAIIAMMGGNPYTTKAQPSNTPMVGKNPVTTQSVFNKSNLHFGDYTMHRLGTPRSILWRNYSQILQDNKNVLRNARLQEAYNKYRYGDNGSSFMNYKLNDSFSFPTNSYYLNSLTNNEQIAGTDDMELSARRPSTFSGFFPYGFDITKLKNSVNSLNYGRNVR